MAEDPRNAIAVAQVVASNNKLGVSGGATANNPLTFIVDPIQPPAKAKTSVTSTNTTATCPVDSWKMVVPSDGVSYKRLPLTCPKCGYGKLTYS